MIYLYINCPVLDIGSSCRDLCSRAVQKNLRGPYSDPNAVECGILVSSTLTARSCWVGRRLYSHVLQICRSKVYCFFLAHFRVFLSTVGFLIHGNKRFTGKTMGMGQN